MYKAEINMLYEQWQDFVKQGVTLAGWEQWLEWEHNDQQTIRDGRDEIEDDLYDGITECLEQEGFN